MTDLRHDGPCPSPASSPSFPPSSYPEEGKRVIGSGTAPESPVAEASVWIAYYLDYEQSYVTAAGTSEEAAIQAVKDIFGPPYIVEWRVERRTYNRGADETVTLIGEFEQVAHYSTKHSGAYDISEIRLASTTAADAASKKGENA